MLGSRTRRSWIAASSATKGPCRGFLPGRSRKGHLYKRRSRTCVVLEIGSEWVLVNTDAGESTQKRAVGGRGGPKRRPRSKPADGEDVEAPADESGEADVVEKEEGGCRIA